MKSGYFRVHPLLNAVMGDHFLRDIPSQVTESRIKDNKDSVHSVGTTEMESVHVLDKFAADREILMDCTHPKFVEEFKKWFHGLTGVGLISLSETDKKWRDTRLLLKDEHPWMENGLKSLGKKV